VSDASAVQEHYWEILGHRAAFVRPPVELSRAVWREDPRPGDVWARLVGGAVSGARTVLDVGAGSGEWRAILPRIGVDAAYASCDVETRHHHDHSDFLALDTCFDAVLMLDLLEHLDAETGLRFLAQAARLTAPTGALVLSTPNPGHPTSYQASDFTHVRPWPAADLYGACRVCGFADVRVHRIQHVVSPVRRALVPVQQALARVLGVDPADHLIVVARHG